MAAIQNDFDQSTDIFDTFSPIIKEKVKNPLTWRRILKLTQEFMSKNDFKLSTNIVGRQVLVSPKMEDEIYDIFGLDRNNISSVMNNSACFKARFNGKKLSLDDQLCLAVPLILAAIEYHKLKKNDESNLCYLLAHFKPYASRESFLFKYGIDEERMLYTIENLSYRFDLKNYGTIIDTLRKKASSSYSNYIEPIKGTEKMTDYRFYVCYTSGISSAVNAFLGGVFENYMKNDGKKTGFENSATGFKDKDTDETKFDDSNIQSDAAVRETIVRNTIQKLLKTPVDKTILTAALKADGSFKPTSYGNAKDKIDLMSVIISEVVDKMSDKLHPFFSALINSFLFHDKPGKPGEKFTMADFKSPLFLVVGVDILSGQKANVKDINLNTCRDIIKNMCEEFSNEYRFEMGGTLQSKTRRCLAFYLVSIMRLANK